MIESIVIVAFNIIVSYWIVRASMAHTTKRLDRIESDLDDVSDVTDDIYDAIDRSHAEDCCVSVGNTMVDCRHEVPNWYMGFCVGVLRMSVPGSAFVVAKEKQPGEFPSAFTVRWGRS